MQKPRQLSFLSFTLAACAGVQFLCGCQSQNTVVNNTPAAHPAEVGPAATRGTSLIRATTRGAVKTNSPAGTTGTAPVKRSYSSASSRGAGEGATARPGENSTAVTGESASSSAATANRSTGESGSASRGPASDTSAGVEQSPAFISDKLAAHIEIKTEAIKERELLLPLFLTGRVEIDNGGEVDVSSRISGRLTDIKVKPGDRLKKGQLMAMLESREVAELEGEMLEAKSKLEIANAHAERERHVYEEQVARPKSLLDARGRLAKEKVEYELAQSEFHRVESLYKEKIAAGKDYMAAKAKLSEEKLEMEQAQTALAREENLFKDQVLRKDYSVALAEVTREKQHLKTLMKRLEFIGADKPLVDQVLKSGNMNGFARIVAPVDGVVNHYECAIGEMVHPDNSIFKLTNLSTVLIVADLSEADLQRVKIGDAVKIKVPAYPHATYTATVAYIAQHINLHTHTLPIRARLANPGGKLKPNMSAEIDVASTSVRALACPKAAVQDRGRHKIVFVKKPGGFEERIVKLEQGKLQYAEVLEGLKSGEEVVTEGSQALKNLQ